MDLIWSRIDGRRLHQSRIERGRLLKAMTWHPPSTIAPQQLLDLRLPPSKGDSLSSFRVRREPPFASSQFLAVTSSSSSDDEQLLGRRTHFGRAATDDDDNSMHLPPQCSPSHFTASS